VTRKTNRFASMGIMADGGAFRPTMMLLTLGRCLAGDVRS
jgi:hypothetical protein